MSSKQNRRIPSRTWLGVAAITLGVGTALTPTVAHAQPETPGNPSGSGSSEPSSQPRPNSTSAEENTSHHATTGNTECSKHEEECAKPGEMVGAGQDTVPAGLGNSTIVGGTAGEAAKTESKQAAEPVPTVGSGDSTVKTGQGTDTIPAGLGNSTIVGGS